VGNRGFCLGRKNLRRHPPTSDDGKTFRFHTFFLVSFPIWPPNGAVRTANGEEVMSSDGDCLWVESPDDTYLGGAFLAGFPGNNATSAQMGLRSGHPFSAAALLELLGIPMNPG
jgi:hypothetical protein